MNHSDTSSGEHNIFLIVVMAATLLIGALIPTSALAIPLFNRQTGQNCLATEKLWDVMGRAASPYGVPGLASYAISAVDTALWDLKGKLLGRPVYELLGGPQKERIPCYASTTDLSYGVENSVAWFL